jgi:hypothetical protein
LVIVKPESVRTTIEQAVDEATPKRPRRLNLDQPIVPSTGKPFSLTNDQIYGSSTFPEKSRAPALRPGGGWSRPIRRDRFSTGNK